MPVALLTLLIALAIFMYGLTSRKNEQLALTPAMLFTSLGMFSGLTLSGGDHSSFALPLDNHSLQLLTELTQLDIAHTPQYQEFFATVVLCILGSIFLYGASARLLTNSDAYARG